MEIYKFLGILIGQPYLALGPAALFGMLYYRRRKPFVLVAALAWLTYFPYEQAMKLRILCSGECNIRVDLLLLYPLLLLFSIIAAVVCVKEQQPGKT